MLLRRVGGGADAVASREALFLATRGGAQLLGRDDCGQLSPGKRADFVIWDQKTLQAAGVWDAVAGLLLSGPLAARDVYVEGRQIVRDGRLTGLDLPRVLEQAGSAMRRLISGD